MNITEIAYELYKDEWIRTHISKERYVKTKRRYLKDIMKYDLFDEDMPEFETWLWDNNGFDGELYVLFVEFLDQECDDVDYMHELLGDELFEVYKIWYYGV